MKKTPLLALSALFLLATPGRARADELIRFKSGYEMMVVSHREENGMVIVSLDGGGEVGFPKSLVETLETGKQSTRTTDSPLFNKVPSRVNVQKFLAPRKQEMPSRFLARGVASSEGVTVGYSKAGDKPQRFSGGPIGDVTNGKIGTDVHDRGVTYDPNRTEQELDHAKKKAPVRKLMADAPNSGDGE